MGVQFFGDNTHWLTEDWQQGIIAVAILLIAGWIATLPLRLVMQGAKVVILLYGLGIFTVGLAGFAWLLSGHAPQSALTTSQPGFGPQNIVLYGVIVLARQRKLTILDAYCCKDCFWRLSISFSRLNLYRFLHRCSRHI